MLLLGVAGVLFALPFWQSIRHAFPGVFRSPSRLIYLTEFALAFGLAAGIDAIRISRARRMLIALVIAGFTVHAIDLARFDRLFIKSATGHGDIPPDEWERITSTIGDVRVGMDITITSRQNRSIDDVGFFDSIMLARPYRYIIDLTNMSPDTNVGTLVRGRAAHPRAGGRGREVSDHE